jgi:hypothetical protein
MARRRSKRRSTWRSLVKRHGVKAAARLYRRRRASPRRARKSYRRRKNAWFGHPRAHRTAAKLGWRRGHRFSRRRIRHNPFAITGKGGGKFELIPSVATLKIAGVQGAGAVASELVRATAYSLIRRDIQGASIAEDAVGRLVSGALTGFLASYVLGADIANQVVRGTYTVAMYQLVADVVGKVTGGQPKLLGFVANPFRDPGKDIIPGFSFGAPAAGMSDILPEGEVVPLGEVGPEGDVLPFGEAEPARMASRF